MSYSLSARSKDHCEGIDPRLIEIRDLAIQITLVDFGIPSTGGVRTALVQNQLFKDGKSNCDGYEKISEHQKGKALDFYAYVHGQASWDRGHLTMVAAAFLQAASKLGYKLSWGGLWKSRNPKTTNGIEYGFDCPHVQIED